MIGNWRVRVRTAALGASALVVLSGVAAAPGAAAEPGVTARTVTVGQVDTLSGPVPGLFEGARDGTRAYFDYVNSTGGVHGRKLVLQVGDDAFSAGKYTAVVQPMIRNDLALVGGFSLFDGPATPLVAAARIPNVAISLSTQMEASPYLYSPLPIVPGGSRLGPFTYYKQKYGTSAVQHVGTLYTSVATAAAQSQADFAAMKSVGYRFVYTRVVGPVETQFTPDVLKMRAAGVRIVYIVGMAVSQVAALAQIMAQQNFHPTLFSSSGVAYDGSYVSSAGSGAEGTESDLQTAMYQGQDAKAVPAVKLFDTWVRKVNPATHLDVYALYGWTSAQLFVQALKAAGPNPTRASLLTQLNKISSFNASGLIATSNPAQKVPGTCWILAKVVNGKWTRIAPSPRSGFTCSPGGYHPSVRPFTRPAP